MRETRSLEIEVSLPPDMADQAEEVQRTDPEFFSQIVFRGITRPSIWQHLLERRVKIDSNLSDHERAILAENPPKEVESPGEENRSIKLDVQIPLDVVEKFKEVKEKIPALFSRIILHGLTRRSIYAHLKEREREQ